VAWQVVGAPRRSSVTALEQFGSTSGRIVGPRNIIVLLHFFGVVARLYLSLTLVDMC
jgi:hypothetical protein